MNSGAFVKDLSTFVANLDSLVEASKDLVGSKIYESRLKRCLSHPGNTEALADFLVLDNLLLGALALMEKHSAQDVRELRDNVVDAAAKYAKTRIDKRRLPGNGPLEIYLRNRTAPMDDTSRKVLKKVSPGKGMF